MRQQDAKLLHHRPPRPASKRQGKICRSSRSGKVSTEALNDEIVRQLTYNPKHHIQKLDYWPVPKRIHR